MKRHVDALVREALRDAIARGTVRSRGEVAFQLAPPRHEEFGDLACDVGLVLARALGESPSVLASAVVDRLQDRAGWLAAVTVGGPGFVNFRFSNAFWRSMLAEALAAGPRYGQAVAGSAGRVLIDVVGAGSDSADLRPVRASVLAQSLAATLREGGWDVTPGGSAPAAVDLAVAVLVPGRSDAVARFRGGLAGAPALRVVGVQPVHLRRDGKPVVEATGLSGPDGALDERARLLLLLERADHVAVLDLEQAAGTRTDNPGVVVGFARDRLARAVKARRATAPIDLRVLDERDVEVLRAVATWPDIVEIAAQTLEPDRIARYVVKSAMAVHRWANRQRLLDADATVAPARMALAGCLERILSRAAAVCGMAAGEIV